MAVIVADSRNSSYDGKLSTANGFYRAEAFNMTCEGTILQLNTVRNVPVTFANAGNCQGIALSINLDLNFYTRRTMTVLLQENVASVWTTRATKTMAMSEMSPDYNTTHGGEKMYYFVSWKEFKFATPYPVDTTTNKWRFNLSQSAVASDQSAHFGVRTSDNTNISFVTWCDNKVTYSDTNDAIVCADNVYIDNNFNPKPYTGTGDTTYGVTVILTASNDINDPYKLSVRSADLAASYTWTIDGVVYVGTGCGIQIGKRSDRIPYAKQFNIVYKNTTSLGHNTSTNSFTGGINVIGNKSGLWGCLNSSIEIAGEIPTLQCGTLAVNAEAGQPVLQLIETPSTWSIGDKIYIGKSSTKGGTGANIAFFHTIQSISGNNITLASNLTDKRWAGGAVVNSDGKYGVKIYSDTTTKGSVRSRWMRVRANWFFDISGFLMQGTGIGMILANTGNRAVNTNEFLFEDATCTGDVNNSFYNQFGFLTGISASATGFKLRRVYSSGSSVDFTPEGPNFTYANSTSIQVFVAPGPVVVQDCRFIAVWNNTTSTFAYPALTINFINNKFQGIQYQSVNCVGNNFIMTGNEFWGNSIGLGQSNANCLLSSNTLCNSLDISNNTFDNNAAGIMIAGTAINTVLNNNSFSQVLANSIDIGIGSFETYSEVVFQNNIGNIILNTDNRIFASPLGFIRFSNFNSVLNDNREYQAYGEIFSTGTGLSDTTSHNGGFAMRFSSSLLGNVRFSQKIPTGNIQSKDMIVGVWVNISSSNYWSSTHTMPRLTVTYDGGTIAYSQASQITGWQYIYVPFTPATTSGIIEVVFTTNTIATGSNSYVYFDDFSALYPAGYQLNLGNMDLWFEGAPVTPMLATNLAAADVWNYATAGLTAPGTTGKTLVDAGNPWSASLASNNTPGTFGYFVQKLLSVAKFLGLK